MTPERWRQVDKLCREALDHHSTRVSRIIMEELVCGVLNPAASAYIRLRSRQRVPNLRQPRPSEGLMISARTSRQAFLAVPGVIFSVFPMLICPACWPAYTGLLSALGLPFIPSNTYLSPATVIFLLIAIAGLGLKAQQRHGYGPFVLGISAAVVLVSKFVYQHNGRNLAATVLLIAASIRNSVPRRPAVSPSCYRCAAAETKQ